MNTFSKNEIKYWRNLGWDNPFWEYFRFLCSLRGSEREKFLLDLSKDKSAIWQKQIGIPNDLQHLIFDYLNQRKEFLINALEKLRTEDDAKKYCEKLKIIWGTTTTKNKDHHQSSKVIIATVNKIATTIASKLRMPIETNPQRRCIWFHNKSLHVTARNLDGAIPGLLNPLVVWEIKEYWGKTSGGSKMSDAVYECQLVGREIRAYERLSSAKVVHIVFVDGKEQWQSRKSDLARLIDLECQGLIDNLFIGRDIETDFGRIIEEILIA